MNNITFATVTDWLQSQGVEYAIRIAAAFVIFLAGAVTIKLLAKVLRRALSRFGGERITAMNFIVSVVVKSAWGCLAIIVLDKLGVDVAPLIAGLGVTGFVLGFAFQESLGSLASGLMLAINQPLKVGDYVIVGGHEGRVLALDMMAVVLATPDNRRVTIPNKNAWGAPIVNFTALELRRVDIAVGVAYGCDLTSAKSVALAAITGVPGVIVEPAPMAEVKSLDDSSIALTVRAWVKNADYWPTFFAGNQAVKEALDRAGIEIPFRQLDINLRQTSTLSPALHSRTEPSGSTVTNSAVPS